MPQGSPLSTCAAMPAAEPNLGEDSEMGGTVAFPEWVEPMAATLTQERFTSPECRAVLATLQLQPPLRA
jgi:hypothetical protein